MVPDIRWVALSKICTAISGPDSDVVPSPSNGTATCVVPACSIPLKSTKGMEVEGAELKHSPLSNLQHVGKGKDDKLRMAGGSAVFQKRN